MELLPSVFLKFVGVCLLAFGFYDTSIYWYALKEGHGSFDFFGKTLPANHKIVRTGFGCVLLFYYAIGSTLLVLG